MIHPNRTHPRSTATSPEMAPSSGTIVSALRGVASAARLSIIATRRTPPAAGTPARTAPADRYRDGRLPAMLAAWR